MPASSWRISGLFDFTTAYFGDGTADLTKITARYLREVGLIWLRDFSIITGKTSVQTMRKNVNIFAHAFLFTYCINVFYGGVKRRLPDK